MGNLTKYYYQILIIVAVITVITAGIVLFKEKANRQPSLDNKNISEQQTPLEKFSFKDGTFNFRIGNFSFDPLPSWELAHQEKTTLPPDIGTPYFIFKRKDMACTFLYTRIAVPDFRKYTQTSFATRVFTDKGDQLDASWYVNTSTTPNTQFQENHQPIHGEIRINHYPIFGNDYDESYMRAFFLFASNGETVSDICDSEFSQMLRTLRPTYDKVPNLSNANGSLYLKSINGETKEKNHNIHLLFSHQASIPQQVMTLHSGYQTTFFKNHLYDAYEGNIWIIDPFANTETSITKNPNIPNEEISDFFISNDQLYYLAGTPCDGPGPCNLNLFSVSLNGGIPQLLAQHVAARSILGYSSAEDKLYLEGGYGDAGCFNQEFYQYTPKNREIRLIYSYAGCEGVINPAADKMTKEIHALENRFSRSISHIHLENGNFSEPPENEVLKDRNTNSFRFIFD